MSYDYRSLTAHVKLALDADASVSLGSICAALQVDRHTINRALIACIGVRFSDLKSSITRELIKQVLADGKVKQIKQVAADIGYHSSSALAKRTRKSFGSTPTAVRQRGRS